MSRLSVKRWLGAVTIAAAAMTGVFSAAPTSADDRNAVFVPLGGNNEIAVIDTGTNKVVERIPGTPAVHGLAKTPDGGLLIAGSFAEVEPDAALPARPAGVSAEDHAAHHAKPGARAAAKDAAISRVTFIRTKDRTIVRRVDVTGPVHHVTTSPDGFFAVVTHPNQDAVSVIDVRSFKVAAVVKTGAVPNYAAFTPDGKSLYVSNSGDNTIGVVDTATWRVKQRIKVGESPEHLVVRLDLGRLFVNNVADGTVSVVNLKDLTVTKALKAGEEPHGIDLSKDGRMLFVSAKSANKLVAIDLKTGNRRELALSPEPYHLKVIEGRDTIYVSSATAPKIWVVDAKAMALTGTIDIGGKGHQMVQ